MADGDGWTDQTDFHSSFGHGDLIRWIKAPHPSILPIDQFLAGCRFSAHRRGGPGGQHRNKVSSAVMIVHEATQISAEAAERRDQSQNRREAISRLRVRLAIMLRTASAKPNRDQRDGAETDSHDAAAAQLETLIRQRWRSRPMKIAESNEDAAAVLALTMDDLFRDAGQPSLSAKRWETSTTSLVQFIARYPAAFAEVNRWRHGHSRPPLKA